MKGREGGGDEVGVKGPGIRRVLLFRPARAASAVCDFRGGSRGLSTSREGREREREREREEGREGGREGGEDGG